MRDTSIIDANRVKSPGFTGSLPAIFAGATTVKPGTAPPPDALNGAQCPHGIAADALPPCQQCSDYYSGLEDHEQGAIERRAMRKQYQAELRADIEATREAHAAKLEAEYQAARQSWNLPAANSNVIPQPPAAVVAALPAMLTDSKGRYEADLDTVRRCLETDGLLSFDTFRGAVMIQQGSTQRPMTDKDYIDLRTLFQREKNYAAIGKDLMRDAVLAESQRRQFDSGITWLDSLTWDGTPRVERFMSTHFGAADDEYTRAVGRYMWTALAGRMLEPGIQTDMVLALQSKQGTKKSTGLAALVPERDWFTDGLSLHEDKPDFKRQLKGKVVVEISELAGLGRADINIVKRVITRTDERWVEKWQTDETVYLRRCVLFASTNEEQFLPPDETGQRRWLPVEITELNRDAIKRDRDQLWAEGAAIFKQSGIAYAEAERLAAGRHAKHEQHDVWESVIEAWLDTPPPAGGPIPSARPLTISEVLRDACRVTVDRQDKRAELRAAKVMRQLGYTDRQMRLDGVKGRWWVRQAPPPPAA